MRSLKTRGALFFVALGIAGCQTAKPIAMTVSVTPTAAGTTGGDVLAPQRAAGRKIPELRGERLVTVRTYESIKKPDAQFATTVELEGISCKLESEGYKASFLTPAQVRVPYYGYASGLISTRCDAPGYRPGFKNVTAFNQTERARLDSASSSGLLAVAVVAVVNAASDPENHEFAYPKIDVTMNRIGCETSPAGCR